MNIEKIFELVRKEQVVLWIGSGFSLYAGYPSGKNLSEIIYQSLSASERKEISQHLSLADLTEQYVRLRSDNRRSLNTLLQKEFLKQPTVKKWHEILAKIPHIKTVVTTNYDRLFELAYKDNIQPIIFSKDIANRDNRVELFKVHGDIDHLDTIVITTDDYTNFYLDQKQDDLLWSVIKERVSNKHVVFIGYSLEDENVKLVFKQISKSLGDTQKQMFLIAPGFKKHNVQYLNSLKIDYLDFKGEAFIEKLFANIKDRITDDFSKQYISVETLRKFYRENNITVDLKATDDRFQISEVNALNNTQPQIDIKFKNNKPFLDSFKEIIDGHRFGDFVVSGNQLEQLRVFLNDVNILSDTKEEYQITISSKPQKEGIATIVFDDSLEFEDVNYRLFVSKELIEIVANYKGAEFSMKISGEMMKANGDLNAKLDLNIVGNFNSSTEAISIFKLALNIWSGVGFTAYLDNDMEGKTFPSGRANGSIEMFKSNIDFFESLKKVEKLYNVRFTNFAEYAEEDFHNVYKAVSVGNGEQKIRMWDKEIVFNIDKEMSVDNLLSMIEGGQIMVTNQNIETLVIYGQGIEIGYLVFEPLDVYIENIDELRSKTTFQAIIKSRTNKIRLYYKTSL